MNKILHAYGFIESGAQRMPVKVVEFSEYERLRAALELISDGNVMQRSEHTHADTVVEYQRIATEALGIVKFDYFQGESDRHWYYVQRGVSAIEAKGPFMTKTCAEQHAKDGTFRVID